MEEFKDGQSVRMKTCVSWSGWPGKVLHRKGDKYEVETDKPHFGQRTFLVNPQDLRPLTS